MECSLFLMIILVLLGLFFVERAPLLLIDGFRAVTSVIAERGAFAVGCVAGTFSPLLFVSAGSFWSSTPGTCLSLALVAAVGALLGAAAGMVWALVRDGNMSSCAGYGGAGGAVASPIGLGVLLFLAMLFFGG